MIPHRLVRLALLVLSFAGSASAADGLIASPEAGWPQWRGPRRDGISRETGLLRQWPEGGPARVWKAEGVGRGYSSPVIVGNRIFITGDIGEDLVVHALDLGGKPVWQAKNGAAWKTPYPGARATCACRAGKLYNLNAHGRLACFDAADGRELWAVDVLERFGGRNITWALSEGVLVDGDRVFVTAGGERALMAALDRHTGATVWQSPPLRLGPGDGANHERLADPAGEADGASYASPILFSLNGRKHLVNASLRHLFGVDADTGALLWTRPLKTTYAVIAATPVLSGDGVFGTAPDGEGGLKVSLRAEGTGVVARTAWRAELDSCQGALIADGDVIHGPWYRGKRGWACLDAATGRVRFDTREVAIGSAILADGALISLGQDGEAALLRPSVDRYEVRGRFPLTERRVSDAWAHPVLLDGRLYLRYHDALHCFDLKDRVRTE